MKSRTPQQYHRPFNYIFPLPLYIIPSAHGQTADTVDYLHNNMLSLASNCVISALNWLHANFPLPHSGPCLAPFALCETSESEFILLLSSLANLCSSSYINPDNSPALHAIGRCAPASHMPSLFPSYSIPPFSPWHWAAYSDFNFIPSAPTNIYNIHRCQSYHYHTAAAAATAALRPLCARLTALLVQRSSNPM
jgi:hypothetical protein